MFLQPADTVFHEQKRAMKLNITPTTVAILIAISNTGSVFASSDSQTQLNARFVHYDRNFNQTSRDRKQTGTGFILRHQRWNNTDTLKLNVAAYAAQPWQYSGQPVEDAFASNSERLRSIALIGEASLTIKPTKKLSIELGRFKHASLLLKSKTLALPSTFQGVNIRWQPTKEIEISATQFDRWSRRANDRFNGFSTNTSAESAIDHIRILGAKFKHRQVTFNAETLLADEYLNKFGATASMSNQLGDHWRLNTKVGVFTSRDAGELFINGASSELDSSSQNNIERLEHRGLGGYLRFRLNKHGHHFTIANSRFNQPWLEDSFSNDHGTNPFPTKTIGPDLSNANESVWLTQYSHQWSNGALNGLQASIALAKGTGAENSISPELGTASESWLETDIRYSPPQHDAFKLRLRYRDYRSNEQGRVAGVKADRDEFRFLAEYAFSF